MRIAYPSDVTRIQFELIEHDLQSARKATRPRKYALYDLFCAVLCTKKAAHGGACRMISQNGISSTTITKYGAQQARMERNLCLIRL